MFLYAATPDFRSDVIIKFYQALNERIGNIAFLPGRPMTPLIDLQSLNTNSVLREIGENLLVIFAKAEDIVWNQTLQYQNIETLIQALKNSLFYETVPPRYFVYHYCRLLTIQKQCESLLDIKTAEDFVTSHDLHDMEEQE